MIKGIVLALLLLASGQFTVPTRTGATSSSSSPYNACLISAWPMNEGAGLTLHDTSTGGTNTATINTGASATWQSNAGLPGTTPLWNGSGYALATSTTLTNFTGTTPFSVSVWIKFTTAADYALLSTLNATAGTYQGWELAYQNTSSLGVIFFLINNYPSNAMQVKTAPLTVGNVYYIVVTYDGSQTTAGAKIYFNAVSQTVANAITNTLSATAANGLPVRFGARNNATSEMTGPMAFAEVYNCVLTSTQISTYYASGPGIY